MHFTDFLTWMQFIPLPERALYVHLLFSLKELSMRVT